MATIAHKMVWLQSFLQDLGFMTMMPMSMHYDNQVAIFIARNLEFHERTEPKKDCHIIHGKVLMEVISTPYVSSLDQLANPFTKGIIGVSYNCLGSKLSMFDLYVQLDVRYSSLEGLMYESHKKSKAKYALVKEKLG